MCENPPHHSHLLIAFVCNGLWQNAVPEPYQVIWVSTSSAVTQFEVYVHTLCQKKIKQDTIILGQAPKQWRTAISGDASCGGQTFTCLQGNPNWNHAGQTGLRKNLQRTRGICTLLMPKFALLWCRCNSLRWLKVPRRKLTATSNSSRISVELS